MKIGVLGLTYHSGNKGCEALSYSFLEVLDMIAQKRNDTIEVKIFTVFPFKKVIKEKGNIDRALKEQLPKCKYKNLKIGFCFYRKICKKIIFDSQFKTCDCVFDYTAGDSFTDIYGESRFYERTEMKKHIIKKNIPLILGSQTIGPFRNEKVRQMASEVINDSKEVFVRDEMSYEYTKKISGRTPILTTDIAFYLPYIKEGLSDEKVKIGINPSGLLWSGGYTRDNQFGLTIDYRNYCQRVIEMLLTDSKYEIYLIPHATAKSLEFPDNDNIAIRELKKKYPDLKVVKQFDTAIEAKSFISGMDIFLGARMHATIAAMSSKVPVIPISYSRKFEGLYNSLQYPYVIEGKSMSTDKAVDLTLSWINNMEELKACICDSEKIIQEKNEILMREMEKVIFGQ